MTILLTGGTGKTGAVLARLLHAANHPFIIATRSGKAPEPFKAVAFDWVDASTFENPFKADSSIDRVYLVMPQAGDIFAVVSPFIDLAISKGVKRFVLLTATMVKPGDYGHGQVHRYLLDKGVDYSVLKPSWFMQNFSTRHAHEIRETGQLTSATGDGKIPWISSEDIAQAAFNDLTAEKSPNKEYLILGPQLYTMDETVKLLSSVIGKEIIHKKVTVAEQTEVYKKLGIPDAFAAVLAYVEGIVAEGKEAAFMEEPEDRKYVGKRTIEQFFKDNRQVWTKE